MPALQETAYPRLKSTLSSRELSAIYTPTWDEIVVANRSTKGTAARWVFGAAQDIPALGLRRPSR